MTLISWYRIFLVLAIQILPTFYLFFSFELFKKVINFMLATYCEQIRNLLRSCILKWKITFKNTCSPLAEARILLALNAWKSVLKSTLTKHKYFIHKMNSNKIFTIYNFKKLLSFNKYHLKIETFCNLTYYGNALIRIAK